MGNGEDDSHFVTFYAAHGERGGGVYQCPSPPRSYLLALNIPRTAMLNSIYTCRLLLLFPFTIAALSILISHNRPSIPCALSQQVITGLLAQNGQASALC